MVSGWDRVDLDSAMLNPSAMFLQPNDVVERNELLAQWPPRPLYTPTMSKLAVDIVLLPPDDVVEMTIKLNKQFVEDIDDEIALHRKRCLPHITLAMGIIDDSQVSHITKRMQMLAAQFSPPRLSLTSVNVTDRPDGRKMSSLVVENSKKLQELHEATMDEIAPAFSYDNVTTAMFYSPPTVNEVPTWWVKGFAKTAVRENYRPHITLGLGVPDDVPLPIESVASTLALCHLGNYCTCRRVFASSSLSGQ